MLNAPTKAEVVRILDAIGRLAGTPPDRELSLVAFRDALAEL